MPRIKLTSEAPFIGVARLIRGYGVTTVELADILQVSRGTARSRMLDPQKFTLDELKRIVKRSGIPADEMREAVKFG